MIIISHPNIIMRGNLKWGRRHHRRLRRRNRWLELFHLFFGGPPSTRIWRSGCAPYRTKSSQRGAAWNLNCIPPYSPSRLATHGEITASRAANWSEKGDGEQVNPIHLTNIDADGDVVDELFDQIWAVPSPNSDRLLQCRRSLCEQCFSEDELHCSSAPETQAYLWWRFTTAKTL